MKTIYKNPKTAILTFLFLLIFASVKSQQWQNVSPAGYNYFSTASFINDKEGWICARYGEWPNFYTDLVHTDDAALSFQPVYSFPDNYLAWSLQMVDSVNGYSFVEDRSTSDIYFWKTTDAGISWIDITDSSMFKPNGPFYSSLGYFFVDKNNGFAGGFNSIFKTTDGGLSWIKMNTPTIIDTVSSNSYIPNKIFFFDELYGWAACSLLWDAGFVLKTTDGGQNWITCKPITGNLTNIHFTDSLHGGTTGGDLLYSRIALFTDDNFDTISHYYLNNFPQLPDAIYFQNASTIWMSGWPAVIYKSTDGGESFVEYDTTYATDDQTDWLHDFQFFDSTGYAFAYSFILKIVDTLHTSVNSPVAIQELNIIPNPARSTCIVSFVSESGGKANINLYTVEGILALSEEKYFNSGKNELVLDISKLAPGMYVLKINNKSHIYTSRLIKQP
jgi:photosystem II stability/assembly factor-like uncharacterized protein